LARTPRVKKWFAPGRVNLIGEHTDYNMGFVMPMALDMGCTVRSSPARRNVLHVTSKQYPGELIFPLDVIPGMRKTGAWADYVLGVAQQLVRLGITLAPMKLEIDATVPTGSGLSSPVPARRAGVRRDAVRHHGSVRLRLRRRAQGDPAGLPLRDAPDRADS
jgi:galactokinase